MNFNNLDKGYIYLIKSTLNQFAYEINKLQDAEIIIQPIWTDISQIISSNSPFIDHKYLVIFEEDKIPCDLYIGENNCYTIFILASDFKGELTTHKKLFKSCHKPYFAIDILNKNYLEEKGQINNLSKETINYLNLNPKIDLTEETILSNTEEINNINIADYLMLGDLSLWSKSNRSLFYRYLISNNSSKYNFTPLDKAPYNIPASLWIIFIIYCKEKTKLYNLHPEYLIKLFAVWVYLTKTYYATNKEAGFSSFINHKDKKKYYSFATNEDAFKGLKKITKMC